MKSNKGFTLIELLAVIVILAIIALIATPLTLNVINTARTKAAENSAYGVLDGARLYYAEQMLLDTPVTTGVKVSNLSLSGTAPTNAADVDVTYEANGEITIGTMEFKYGCFSVTKGKLATVDCPNA